MINLIQNFDEYSFPNEYQYYYSNEFNSSLLSRNENTFSLPLNESPIKQKNNNKLFITKKTMKEKIEHQKMKLGKDNNKEIYFDKKEDLKRRNREAAQNSRNKKN